MEKQALRVQKSVFVTDLPWQGVLKLLEEVRQVISLREDLVQAWRLATDQPTDGVQCGSAVPLYPAAVVHDHGQNFVVSTRSQRVS